MMHASDAKFTFAPFKSFFSRRQKISRQDLYSRIIWNWFFEMALSEFEVIVGGLTSIPVLAGIFFLIEKTYGSKNYLRKPVKASPAPKAAAPKTAASKAVVSKAATPKATASKQKDGVSVEPSSAKNVSSKLKTSVSAKKSSASQTSMPAKQNPERSIDTPFEKKDSGST